MKKKRIKKRSERRRAQVRVFFTISKRWSEREWARWGLGKGKQREGGKMIFLENFCSNRANPSSEEREVLLET